jgi:hypothetical protein
MGDVIGNGLVANAALARLTHHVHTMVIGGQSYRQKTCRNEVPDATPALPAE